MPGRFFLGVGTGENLNEHVVGQGWPETEIRQARLEEAVEVIRLLFSGKNVSHHGTHFTVENARLYTMPDIPPPIMVAVGGRRSATMAARIGDGLIGTDADAAMLRHFDEAGGRGKPRYAEVGVCWGEDERAARRLATEVWPTAAMESALAWELALPSHFEAVAQLVTEEKVAEVVTCGPDADRHLEAIRKYAEAGYDHVCVHQIGPQQEEFIRFYQRRVLPHLDSLTKPEEEPSVGRRFPRRRGGRGPRRRRPAGRARAAGR
jgi:G6PDH family F420-dependent oxidoreductase